ncbi:MAG: hypothetical protein ACTSYL_06605 [Candidatus Thorarchaeota archaeon]
MDESPVDEMYRLAPIVKDYDEFLFGKIIRAALDTGISEIDITGWSFEAVRTLLSIIRYMNFPPVLKSGERIHIFVRPPFDEMMDPFALHLISEPW